tara:strand:- start:8840 stop:9091 length:252 start_codon:yes stop_codon:yes gene_type:complete
MYGYHPAQLLNNDNFVVSMKNTKENILDCARSSEEEYITICGALYGAMAAIVEESDCMEMAISMILDHASLCLQQNYLKNKMM